MKIKHCHSLRFKILFSILPLLLCTLIGNTVYHYHVTTAKIKTQLDEQTRATIQLIAAEFENELNKSSQMAISLANYAAALPDEDIYRDTTEQYIRNVFQSQENTVGGGIFYEPFAGTSGKYMEGLYICKKNNTIFYTNDYSNDVFKSKSPELHNFYQNDWYRCGADNNGKVGWSDEVYYDALPDAYIFSTSVAFFDQKGNVKGIGEADISISQLRELVRNIAIGKTGRAFIIGTNGEFISWFDDTKNIGMRIQDDKELSAIWTDLQKTSGFQSIIRELNGERKFWYSNKLPAVGWTLIVTVDESELNSSIFYNFLEIIFIPVLGCTLISIACIYLSSHLTKITNKVNSFAKSVAKGHVYEHIAVTEQDEFGIMETYLNVMIDKISERETMLETTNATLTEQQTELEKKSAELLIQADMLQNQAAELEEQTSIAVLANQAKSDFLSQMSHEIRTPLNAVLGMTHIGMDTDIVERKNYAFDKIKEASTHLLGIINDILDISKIEAHKLILCEGDFYIEDSIQKIAFILEFQFAQKSIAFDYQIDQKIPKVLAGDEQRWSQVLLNLLSNAIKFTPENGKISLLISHDGTEDGRHIIRALVRDNGIGIAPGKLSSIFNAFEQADNSISRRYGGTGLGLAISQSIAGLMQGSLSVESTVGTGSDFIFISKLKQGIPANIESRRHKTASLEEMDFSDKYILVAEDIDINQIVVGALLEDTGIRIDFAGNGKIAVDMFCRHMDEYHLILMDVHMPEMDGFEATRQIRALPFEAAKNIPIIATTADVFNEDIKKCTDAGMNDHIGKPIDAAVLLAGLKKYLC